MAEQIARETAHQWRLVKASRSPSMTLLLRRHIDHLSLSLFPLLSINTGGPHQAFPKTLLHYHILTEEQLDSLAHFYHQSTPSEFSLAYPAPIVYRWNSKAHVEDKRRRFGRFVGLRGCESPDGCNDTELDQREMDRWVEEKIRQTTDRERLMESWRSKGY